ncbi:MAG: cation:proton antiporter [Campylobacterales bacterium]|nr:cation:proton antiporter [Campylobacterales bacterium]
MQNLAFLSQLAFLIVLAPIFARITKIPITVIEITLGTIAVWIGYLDNDNDIFKTIAKIGFFYLMFLAGLEIDLRKFIHFKDKMFKNTLLYFGISYAIAFGLFVVFGLNPVYIVAIPILSLGMIVALINDYGKDQRWLELALTIGAIGELISITALVIFDALLADGWGLAFYKSIATLILILIVIYYFFRFVGVVLWWFPELRKIIMPENDNMGQDIRVSMALFFVLIAAMQYHNIDMVLGAFVAGVFVGNFFKHKTELPETLNAVGFGFLVPLFFVYVGTTLDLDVVFKPEIIEHAFLIIIAMVSVRMISSFVSYYRYLGFKDTILFSLSHSMPLTFLVAIATIAINTRAISMYDYYAFVLAAMIEGIGIMIVIKLIMHLSRNKHKLIS